MNVLLVTLGSHGDVHPFVGVGRKLLSRGHRVRLLTNGHFETMARTAGIEFEPLGDEAEYLRLSRDPDLWHPTRSWKVVFEEVLRTLQTVYELVAAHVGGDPENALVAGSTLALGARVARDAMPFPLATVHLAPSVFRSCIDPPRLPGLIMPKWLPLRVKRGIWEGGDRYVLDPYLAPRLNALRARLGLPPVKRVLFEWWNSPDRVIGMFPDWFAPVAPDWPVQTRLTHFPLFDERDTHLLPPELEAFLDECAAKDEPPIAFTAGSAMLHAHEFFEAAADACGWLDRPGLLLTRFADQLPAVLPGGVRHVSYAPFSALLPRVGALVHHGGIGTTAQALAAGCPQLVMPMAHDQYDNARRVVRLGCAAELSMRRFAGRNVARVLADLTGPGRVRDRCREVASRFTGDGIAWTCDLLEELQRERAGSRTGAR